MATQNITCTTPFDKQHNSNKHSFALHNPRHSAGIKLEPPNVYHYTPIKPNGHMIITRTTRTITTTVQLPNDIKAEGRRARERLKGGIVDREREREGKRQRE